MTRRYTDYDDLIAGLDSESLLDDPTLGSFDEEELAMLGTGPSRKKPVAEEKPKPKRGRPKKKQD